MGILRVLIIIQPICGAAHELSKFARSCNTASSNIALMTLFGRQLPLVGGAFRGIGSGIWSSDTSFVDCRRRLPDRTPIVLKGKYINDCKSTPTSIVARRSTNALLLRCTGASYLLLERLNSCKWIFTDSSGTATFSTASRDELTRPRHLCRNHHHLRCSAAGGGYAVMPQTPRRSPSKTCLRAAPLPLHPEAHQAM